MKLTQEMFDSWSEEVLGESPCGMKEECYSKEACNSCSAFSAWKKVCEAHRKMSQMEQEGKIYRP